MENLTNIGTIRALLDRHGFTFSKALGQNFLINPSVCPRMAAAAVDAAHIGVLEIGPGIGVLTNELCKVAEKVVAVELDHRLIPVLDETLGGYDNLTVINADIMEIDLQQLIAQQFSGMEVAVCANLPYYITSPVIMRLLESRLPLRSLTVMVQREAAMRLCARPGTRDSSAITVAVRYYSEPELLFPVSAGSFLPAPRVDSAVIRLTLRSPERKPQDERTLFSVVRGAFSQRRKTVLNALSSSLALDKTAVRAILEEAGIDPAARAEQLSVADFVGVADAVYDRSS